MSGVVFVVVAATASILRWQSIESLKNLRSGSGTIAVNVIGSFVLGVVIGMEVDQLVLVAVAGLGSFTTFSTMALDFTTVPRREALGYLATTLVLGLLAAWIGLEIGGR